MFRLLCTFVVGLLGLFGQPAHASSQRGTISIVNERPQVVQVWVGQSYRGEVRANSRRAFSTRVGTRLVEITSESGRSLEKTRVDVRHNRIATVRVEQGSARVELINRSGTALKVELDGVERPLLAAGESRTLKVRPGRHTLDFGYTQLGSERTLTKRTLQLSAGERERIELRPASESLVRVINQTGQDATIRVDGELVGTVDRGQTTVIEVDVGTARIELSNRSRVLDTTTMQIQRYGDNTFRAERQTGSLVVVNPLPMDVKVTLSNGRERTVRANAQTNFRNLEPGSVRVEIARMGGETLASHERRIRRGDTTELTVSKPSHGILEIVNDAPRASRIFIDGQELGRVSAVSELRMELEPGRHLVLVMDDVGRLMLHDEITIDRYQTELLLIDRSPARADATTVDFGKLGVRCSVY